MLIYTRKSKSKECHRCGLVKRLCECAHNTQNRPRRTIPHVNRKNWLQTLPIEQAAERMRWYQTRTERRINEGLKELSLEFGLRYEPQVPKHGYILDFFFPRVGLAVEVDGPMHDTKKGKEADARKDQRLGLHGIRVIHLHYSAIDKSPRTALTPVVHALKGYLSISKELRE